MSRLRRCQPFVSASLRYGVVGIYVGRKYREGPDEFLIIRVYPVPFIRLSFEIRTGSAR